MSTNFNQQEIPVKATLDVQAVETALNQLWREKAGADPASEGDDSALMRARVLNLMFYVTSAEAASEVNEILSEVSKTHPCRALVMLALAAGVDQDIEMFISTYCPESADAGGRRLCCEQVTLRARGRFTVELPSAATPLLVSDLPVFLYWRDQLRPDDGVFRNLSREADRVILDSAEFQNPLAEMAALVRLISRRRSFDVAFSDLNWSRLTSWRALLASFYDVQDYRPALEQLSRVMIEYVAPAPQALMLAGWLASRLGWQTVADEASQVSHDNSADAAPDKLDQSEIVKTRVALLEKDERRITVEFRQVMRPEMKPGRLARVELKTESNNASTFVVSRSEDGLYLETQVTRGEDVRAARVLKVRNRSAAALVGRELEIVIHEDVYEEALKTAARIAGL
jgi:glucose-6-phosphate dehydrogenase assembly protein OpcA